jgi:two-component system response regulator (stage 0 sporulation protein A)
MQNNLQITDEDEINCEDKISNFNTKELNLFFQKILRGRPYWDNGSKITNDGQPENKDSQNLDKKISAIFITIGSPPHIKGYYYLRYAIKSCIKEPEIISAITKRLYPSVADYFNATASKVERAIRHAIEVCWNRGRIEALNNLFNSKIFTIKNRPTNGEFIALIADKLILEM